MHEDAHDDSLPLSLEGIDAGVLDVRLLAPLDLAVSKISRFSEHGRRRGSIELACRIIEDMEGRRGK